MKVRRSLLKAASSAAKATFGWLSDTTRCVPSEVASICPSYVINDVPNEEHPEESLILRLESEDHKRLTQMLSKMLPEATPRDVAAVLNLACGPCKEAHSLARFVQEHYRAGLASHVGIDIREKELDHARDRLEREGDTPNEFRFVKGSGDDLSRHGELADEFDVVFIRHQNLYNGTRLWENIFDEGLGRVGENGLLVITSYFDHEHRLATDSLTRLGAELVSTQRNMASRQLPTPGKSIDRHVAVFRRADR